jgi:hypothetical protein
MTDGEVSRKRAIQILEAGHAEVRGLISRLPTRALTTHGLGGGAWSPKDLIGHLASWEEYALAALDAWDRGEGVPIDNELWAKGTSAVNVEAVRRKSKLSMREMVRRSDATHAELMERMRDMSDTRWTRPGTSRGRKSVGQRLGGILGGPKGPFRHADAHLRDLRAFVEARAS